MLAIRIVEVDPEKSPLSKAIFEYGKEQYEIGLWRGAIYAMLVFTFLFGLREYIKSKIVSC
jgi:hypothetical protein